MKQLTHVFAMSLLGVAFAAAARAADDASTVPERWSAHGQVTLIGQDKPPFDAAYSGPNSLSPAHEQSETLTVTGMFGARLWDGAEIYYDPEAARGIPLSNLTGLGGLTNGDAQKASGTHPSYYTARLFLRQIFGLGGGSETIESDSNQLATMIDRRRITLTMGKLAITDIFDSNEYAHDPRRDFMNWSMMDFGAYDFAADARGYTEGIALEYRDMPWAIRIGRFTMPKDSNGLALDHDLMRHYGDQLEVARQYMLAGRVGQVRALVFHNRAAMGSYAEAVQLAENTLTLPDLGPTRHDRNKYGAGIGLEQHLSEDLGAFIRMSRDSGEQEEFSFAEIDQSLAAGLSFSGKGWSRPGDTMGLGTVRNALSTSHRRYLELGGQGFFLGDGALNYHPETIVETYYSWNAIKHVWLSADYQYIRNPGYNADRGPAAVASLRMHAEF